MFHSILFLFSHSDNACDAIEHYNCSLRSPAHSLTDKSDYPYWMDKHREISEEEREECAEEEVEEDEEKEEEEEDEVEKVSHVELSEHAPVLPADAEVSQFKIYEYTCVYPLVHLSQNSVGDSAQAPTPRRRGCKNRANQTRTACGATGTP